jgi:outer membrane protein OmpA-like peptidoglycan-associated protein
VDAQTQKPIANAKMNLLAQQLQTQADGHFQSQNLPPGIYALEIHAPGYAPKIQTVVHEKTVTEIGAIPLLPAIPHAQLTLSLKRGSKATSGEAFLRKNNQNFHLSTGNSPLTLPAGPQSLEILPKDGLAKIHHANLSPGKKQNLSLEIENSPASPLVRLANQRILFAEPLAFASNRTELTAYGQTQLRNLVDLLVRNHIRRLRIESHVEAQTTEARAIQFSAQRSKAVVEALAKLGVDMERIEVLNLGDARPVAPNTIRKGRLLNRRMDFVVLEKWEPLH